MEFCKTSRPLTLQYFQTSRPKDSPNSIKTLIQTPILFIYYSLILGQGCQKVLK